MKVVSLSPSLTDILLFLGREDALLAVTDHCPEVAEKSVRVGPPKILQVETIRSLQPDLVLADAGQNTPEDIRALEKHLKVETFDVRSPGDVMDTVKSLGRTLDALGKSQELNLAIRTELQESERVFSGTPPAPTLLLFWYKPYLTVNFDTYASRLLEASGGYNVFHPDSKREFEVELEEMIKRNPSVALMACDSFAFQKRHLTALKPYRVFSKIPMEIVRGQLFTRFGPQTVEALKTLRQVMKKVTEGNTKLL